MWLSVLSICLWQNCWMSQDATWHRGRPWSRTHCVRWGLSSPPQRGTAPSQFLAHICCGQTAGWIKMPLGRKVGRGPSDTVLDGNAAPPFQSGTTSPISGPCLLWPNSCMDQDASWYGGWRRPRPHCVRQGPSSPCERGTDAPPLLSADVYCGHGHPSQLLPSSCFAELTAERPYTL